ncbi:hypothetical protein [Marinobacterium rhizophilum]|uniref:hypothetical protein n=1 Tax=Marinobacterium rhizophilum TaxID=420402 RepID=UPI00035FC9AE|nr:hypothetical protein [Marinobacterium rhizophilum]
MLGILDEQRVDVDDVAPEQMCITRIAECRYYGQGFELRAEFPVGPIDHAAVKQVIESFHCQHKQDYGYDFRDAVVELVTLRVIGNAQSQKLVWAPLEAGRSDDIDEARLYERETVFDDGVALITPRYDRTKLRANAVIEGPAMLMQHDSTSMVPPGWIAKVTPHGNVIISKQ